MSVATTLPEHLADAIKGRIDDLSNTLLEVSHSIHANPELAFEERHAAGLLSDTLDAQGLPVTPLVITVDPERDTVDSMSPARRTFSARTPCGQIAAAMTPTRSGSV